MNSLLQKVVIRIVKVYYRYKKSKEDLNYSILRKKINDIEVEIKHALVDFFYLLIGVFSASFGLKGFLIPSSFIDGGVTGISLIVKELTYVPLSVLLFAINIPFLIMAYKDLLLKVPWRYYYYPYLFILSLFQSSHTIRS